MSTKELATKTPAEKAGELAALATKGAFNDLARRAAAKGAEMLSLIWKAGEIATQAKDAIPHGEWMPFVEQHYDVNHSTVTRWMQFRAQVPESKLCTVHNLTAGIKMLEPPKAKPKPRPEPPATPPDAPKPDSNSEPTSPPEGRQTAAQDYGKCPVCAGVKWTEDEDGMVCKRCRQVWGEPAGDPDEDRLQTQRAKTRKTMEAALRAFDDLQTMHARAEYDEAVLRCKQLLAIATNWR